MLSSAKACPAVQEIPGRSSAEKALAAAHRGGRRSFFYAAVFLADHLPEIIEQGDYETADRALLSFCQHLAGVFDPAAHIYRWSGTSLVVMMERHVPVDVLEWEISRIPVSGARRLFPVAQYPTSDQLCREIDLFVAQNL